MAIKKILIVTLLFALSSTDAKNPLRARREDISLDGSDNELSRFEAIQYQELQKGDGETVEFFERFLGGEASSLPKNPAVETPPEPYSSSPSPAPSVKNIPFPNNDQCVQCCEPATSRPQSPLVPTLVPTPVLVQGQPSLDSMSSPNSTNRSSAFLLCRQVPNRPNFGLDESDPGYAAADPLFPT